MEQGQYDYVMAIDPGLSGAIALYHTVSGVLEVDDIPVQIAKKTGNRYDLARLRALIEENASFADACVVEKVTSMPRQGVASAFNFGYGCGLLDGLLEQYPLPVYHITPAVWKAGAGIARLGPTAKRADRKNAARDRACEVFPKYTSLFARVKDDGRAEAALLAWWFSLNHHHRSVKP